MLEMLLSPKKAERHPWMMFIVGVFYAALAFGLVNFIFGDDLVLASYSGILLVTFTVMFTMPFIYYVIKREEEKDLKDTGSLKMLLGHHRIFQALIWMFIGFLVAFSLGYVLFPQTQSFKAQIETFCSINRPGSFDQCVTQYGVRPPKQTAAVAGKERLFIIFSNNIYVLIFTLVFSLIFGAGAVFVLAWNATVIAAAIGIFSRESVINIPIGLARYMTHGIIEIGAYFVGAVAGGIISIAIIKHEINSQRFWNIMQDSFNLIIIAILLLAVGAFVEVFITPWLF
ncbi:stage II sporulation protein M [Candidatus Pacearchaeota archaeon]|nr:stage II sporulation protein M [Candidatus Pacearchaeota archaeon]